MGGRGSVVRSFLGALILAVMGSGLVQKAAAAPSKKLITGCVIVAAVILDYYRQRFSRARRWSPDGAGSTTREDAREELPRATAPSDNKDSGG